VSIAENPALAEQATVALADLLAGLVAAGAALDAVDPALLTEGLVAAILRLGFVLHAEARGLTLTPALSSLADHLESRPASELAAGSEAWGRVQAISRRLLGASASPGRGGLLLLDPDAYPFLDAPISDAATKRVLGGLRAIEGERVAYEALPIEGLGGIYEALLGISVTRAAGRTVALRPDHALVDLDALLACAPEERVARVEALTLAPLAPRRRRALVAATSIAGLLRAFAGRLSPRTPTPIDPGSWVVGSATSRRRSGSHYTPPALTAEVVAAALAPHLDEARDAEAILAITVCDPAMGSGAFLLEAARFLGDRLLRVLDLDLDLELDLELDLDLDLDLDLELDRPVADDDAIDAARRAVAVRCLHGVDKDPVAVELARLSLWMLAGGGGAVRDFLGEKLRCGDSLLGARREDLTAYPPTAKGSAGSRRREPTLAGLTLADFDAAARDAQERALDAWTALWLWPDEHAATKPRPPALAAYLAAAAAGDASFPGVERARALAAEARFLHWPAAFPEVFARGGFDAVIGNPPWVAFAGRAAQPLPPSIHRYHLRRSPAFFGYRTLHGLFLHLGATLLRPGGRLGLILPTSVSDLDGYEATRRAHDSLAIIDADLPDFGAAAFEGVFQPAMALLSTRREGPPPAGPFGAPWRLARGDLDLASARLLERLSALPPLPPALFGERGYQTLSEDAARLGDAPASEESIPLREGRDVGPFLARPPRVFLDPRGLEGRIRSAESFGEVKLLIRQTARFPIAALSDGLPFRNSILAGFGGPAHSPHFLVAYLNAAPTRWLHHARFRDARQGMPQVKIAHLRAIPAPPHADAVRERLEALGRTIGAANRGIEESDALILDELVAEALGLSADELSLVRAWTRDNPAPRSVYDSAAVD
jgi:hypothetical protein